MAIDQAKLRAITPVDDVIVHARDFPTYTVFSWERNGDFFSLFPGDEGEAPYDATKIVVRLYPFPGVAVREIHLDARSRTHHHIAHEDILFYQVSGRRVQIVNERSRELNPGDASLQIAGVWKRVDQIIAGVFVEFSILRPYKDDAEASWAMGRDTVSRPVAEWSDGAHSHVVEGAATATAPGGASRYAQKTFDMQGYQLHEVTLPKGAVMAPRTCAVDTAFYIVSGRMRAEIGDRADEVEGSDAMRAPAETSYGIAALEDSVFIYAHIPPTRPGVY